MIGNEPEDGKEIKPVMKFTARCIYGKIHMKSACDRSSVLLQLIGRPLEVGELNMVSKLGFDILVVGDKKEFRAEVGRIKDMKSPSAYIDRTKDKWKN